MKNAVKKLSSFVLAASVVLGTLSLGAINETAYAAENIKASGGSRNEGVTAVPTPGEVKIDGDLSDWDWSGRFKMFEFYTEMDTRSVESAMMYDDKYLYIASKFKDQTPLNNPIDPVTEAEWTWRGDGHQFRVYTDDKPIWINFSYYEPTDVSSMFLTYWKDMSGWTDTIKIQYLTESGSTVFSKTVAFNGTPKRIDTSGEAKWVKDADGAGYTMEMKIPWGIIYGDASKGGVPGSSFKMAFENKWTNDLQKGTNSFTYSDNYQPGTESLGIGDYDGWGDVLLSPTGNIAVRKYVADLDADSNYSIHIYPKVPKDSEYLTLVMDDESGNRVANIVSELKISEKNIVSDNGDTYTVDVTWNGKGLYGEYVKAGDYVISGITHKGVRVFLDYTFYNPGTPAWATDDGTGGFGSDHSAPIAAASNGTQTFIGYNKSESGYALIAIGEDGIKDWSIKRGAKWLAATDDYLYAIPDTDFYYNSLTTGNTYLCRIDKETGSIIPFVLNGQSRITELNISTILNLNQEIMPEITGFAAYGDEICFATAHNNENRFVPGGTLMNYTACINVLDAETAVLKKRIPIENIGYLAYSNDGTLYAQSGESVAKVDTATGKITKLALSFDAGMSLGAMTCDNDNNILIFDHTTRQIKAFDPKTGKKLYVIGKEGGRALRGEYDESGFSHMVKNISCDGLGRIWVPEYWEYPRRVSAWNKDGSLWRDYVGTAGYMSAGAVTHQTDETLAYVGANEMKIDHETKTSQMSRVLWVPDYSKNEAFPINTMANTLYQHFTKEDGGVTREYIFGQSDGAEAVLYVENDEGYFQPCFAMGYVEGFAAKDLTSSISSPDMETLVMFSNKEDLYKKYWLPVFAGIAKNAFYIWNDLNGDGAIQIEECEFNTTMNAKNDGWGQRITSDFRFTLQSKGTTLEAGGVWIVSPTEITENGIPRYDFSGFKLCKGVKTDGYNRHATILLEGTNKILVYADNSGTTVQKHNGIWVVDLDQNAKQEWWYLNQYPGVHGSQQGPIGGKNGQVLGPIKCMGVIKVGNEEIFALRGNMGQDFFMTTDGYYIETVFNDGHKTGTNQNFPSTYVDPLEFSQIDFTEGSETGEPFSGCLVYQNDGVVRMGISTGGPCAVITRLKNLDTIKRIDKISFKVTADMITEAKIRNEELEHMTKTVTIGDDDISNEILVNKVQNGDITIDGKDDEWKEISSTNVSTSGVEETANVKLAHDGKNLYAFFRVNDRSPFKNSGVDSGQLFKTGDAVDISLSPTGNKSENVANNDMRILIASYGGKPTAVLMQQVSQTGRNQKLYASPVMNLYFDNVEILRNAEIAVEATEEGAYYNVEVKIPFADIDLDVRSGETISGDIGFIAGNDAGTLNLARVYYFNKDTGLVNDVPNEAKLTPKAWGDIKFE